MMPPSHLDCPLSLKTWEIPVEKPPGGSWEYEGVTYYFCGPGCNRAFQNEAAAYLSSGLPVKWEAPRYAGMKLGEG